MLKILGRKNSGNTQKVLWCCDELGIAAVRSAAETDRFVRDQYQLYERLAERLGLRQ